MMTAFITLLSSYTFAEVLFLLIIVFFLYIIYLKMTDDDYYADVQALKEKYRARMWEYLSGELRIIESISLSKVEGILEIKAGEPIPEDINRQLTMFGMVLERTLHHTLFESVKTAMRLNGFVDMEPDDLDVYVKDKANVLLRESRKSLKGKDIYYPKLRGTDDQRFTLDEAVQFYYKIVKKYIKLHKEEEKAKAEIKKKYSLWVKINFVGAIIRKLKKVK